MEMQEKLYQLSERIKQLKDQIKTEESTKQSFILPFFQALGYDVFNPLEFVPEYTADVGIKKHEKVDYAILQDGRPLILIEAKDCNQKLDKHGSQLFRYFGTTEAKFGILTNGISYQFFTDLEEPNKMDIKPFYELDMMDLNEQALQYLSNFIKSNLDIDSIVGTASDLKYMSLTKTSFKKILDNPSDEFVKLLLNDGIYEGIKNQKVIDKFKPIVKRGINQYINEKMSAKFKETLNSDTNTEITTTTIEEVEEKSKIITTLEELNGYAIIKSILRPVVDAKRLTYKDTESYLNILLDNNTRKWICRLKLDGKVHNIIIPDENKKEVRYQILSLDDIYDYSDQLITVLNRYI